MTCYISASLVPYSRAVKLMCEEVIVGSERRRKRSLSLHILYIIIVMDDRDSSVGIVSRLLVRRPRKRAVVPTYFLLFPLF